MLEKQWEDIYKKVQLNLLDGGTKYTSFEILIKMQEVVKSASFDTEQELEQFKELMFNVYRLASHMAKQPDAKIEDYHCKKGCKHECEVVCAGEYFYIINSKSKGPCPCFNLSQEEIENLAKSLDKHPLG